METSFKRMSRSQRIEAFNVILKSIKLLDNGFDWVDGEKFEDYFNRLTKSKKKEICEIVKHDISYEPFIEYFYNNIEDRINCWKLMFERLSKSDQINLLENEEDFKIYSNTLRVTSNKYDWSEFQCNLLNRKEFSKLKMVKECWNELGTQVYDCRLDSGELCPCLRECSNSATMYKCFESYLRSNGLSPNDNILIEIRKE